MILCFYSTFYLHQTFIFIYQLMVIFSFADFGLFFI